MPGFLTRGRRRVARHRPTALLFGLVAALLVLAGGPAGAQQDRSFVWDSVDVMVQLREDSTLHVTELDRVLFVGGPFHEGYRDIPMARIEGIDQIGVSAVTAGHLSPYRYVAPSSFPSAGANTYTSERAGPNVRISWKFPAATSTSRTFQIAYVVHGVLRVYNDAQAPSQQLGWAGVSRELTKDARVNRASLTFVLPRPVDPNEVVIDGPGSASPRDHTRDGQTWTWTASDLGPGEDLGAILKFPAMVPAAEPTWQDASDRQELLAQQRDSPRNLLFLGLASLIAVGGGLFVLAAWWTKGRDPEVGPVAERLTAPPDDLPPAVVGALVDEAVDQRDIVATVIDLARRGIVRIDGPTQRPIPSARLDPEDITLTLLLSKPDVSRFERAFLESVFFAANSGSPHRVALSTVKERFNGAGEELRELLYAELVQRGFFREPPSGTRWFWKAAGITILCVAIILALAAFFAIPALPWTIFLPVAALAAIGGLVWEMARAMPGKTRLGAEEAAKWRAFRSYLQDIEQFEQIDKAQELFDRYLPYAIVFGLESSWVKTFSRVETPVPQWYWPARWPASLPSGGSSGTGGGVVSLPSGGARSGPSAGTNSTWGTPSLQGVSNQAAQTLQSASNSMYAMFNAAGQTFSGTPAAGESAGLMGNSGFGGAGFNGDFELLARGGLGALKIGLIVFKGLSGGGGGGFR